MCCPCSISDIFFVISNDANFYKRLIHNFLDAYNEVLNRKIAKADTIITV